MVFECFVLEDRLLGVLFSGGVQGVLLGDFWGPGMERLPRGEALSE